MSLDAAPASGLTTRWLERDGAAISWRQAGTGPQALLLLHAFPLNASMWEAACAEWQARFRVLCPVWRGFDGPSRLTVCTPPTPDAAPAPVPVLGPPETIPSLQSLVEDVAAICSVAGIERAIIAGCSLGGYVLLGLLRHYPELVHAAIFCDSRPEPDTPEGRAARLETNRWLTEVCEREGREAGGAALAERMAPRLLGGTSLATRPALVQRVKEWIAAAPIEAVVFANAAMADRPDSRPLLPGIHVPALVLSGEEDHLIPPADTTAFALQIPGAESQVLPHAGHLLPIEDPVAFTQAVNGWMRRHRLL